ncbi:MAG TPA: hypothetical protein VFN97_08015 [Actinospica sp.]|nr:hypothetical protein [Actinospica sp.]
MPVDVLLAAGGGVLWLAAIAWTRLRGPRRPRTFEIPQLPPVPAAGDGPVPEPVRLSLHRKAQRDDSAVLNAAVLELADAGLFHIEPADSQRPAMVSPNVLPHASKLPPYQASVVARLLHRRGVSRQPVPLTALQPGEDDRADTWHKDFTKQVRQDATERGLLQPPASGPQLASTYLLGFLTSGLVANTVSHAAHASAAGYMVFFAVCAPMSIVGSWAGQVRPTRAGRALIAESAAPAAAAAPIPQPRAVPAAPAAPAPPMGTTAVLPNQLQPLPRNQIWSDYGGSWHPLDTESKESYSVSTGIPAVFLLVLFAALSVGGLLFAKRTGAPSGGLPFAVFGALPLILLAGAAASVLRRRNLPKRAVIRGQVAKLWTVTQRGSDSDTTHYFCVLDVGRAPECVRIRANRALYGRLQVGMEIEVLVNPRARRVKDVHFTPHAAGGDS